jgi:hypothetical protein
MLVPFNPALYDSEGNLIVPRYGIRVALGVAFLDGWAFTLVTYVADRKWHELNPGSGATSYIDPPWMYCLWIALPLVPFVLSVLLLSARREEAIAAGAGVVAALFSNSLIFAVAAALASVFFGLQIYSLPTAMSILLFIVCCLWILAAAFRIAAKAGWGIFFLAAGVTLIGMAVAYHYLQSADYKLDREREQQKRGVVLEMLNPDVRRT